MTLNDRVITLDLTQLAHPESAIATQPMAGAPRAIALLSLFDGTGMMRLGLDDLLRRINAAGAL
eukprot:8841746-Lingulodinium_polyedra.AAC.1